ncbi:MAG: alpha/beta hydrolase, partial [Dehalococcoidia bacterium]
PVSCSTFNVDDAQAVRPVRCAYLAVPEDRGRPDGRTIRLAVAVFEAANKQPGEPPLIWLDGGPGGASVELMASVVIGPTGRLLLPGRDLTADRDLVLIDQRGTGHSPPSLACPELAAFESPVLEPAAGRSAAYDAALVCRDRLVADGVNLAAYTSAENAADVNDLRRALGYDQVYLYGVSYGTRLALTVLRDFPSTVRSAVLDSPLPVQADLYVDVAGSAQRALDLVFDGCAADLACGAAYPDLKGTFYDLVARLNQDPIAVPSKNPTTGEAETMQLTGDGLVRGMFNLLYVTPMIPLVPALISRIRDGGMEPFLAAARQLQQGAFISRAMQFSVQCAEEMPFTTPEAVAAAEQAVRLELARAFLLDEFRETAALCAAWPAARVGPAENAPVQSAVPTLILSGRNDPITPPAYAEMAARTLPNSTVAVFPGVAHAVLLSTKTCPYDIAWAFLRDPTARPNTSCAATMQDPAWRVLPR